MPVFIHAQVIFFHVESKTQDSPNLEAETKPESAWTQAVTCKGKSVGENMQRKQSLNEADVH